MSTAAAPGRVITHPPREQIRLEAVLHALSDSHRLAVVRVLAAAADVGGRSEHACTDFDLPLSKSTLTHHFRVLRESGLIYQTYRGSSRLTRLRTEDLGTLFPGLLAHVVGAADAQRVRAAS
ncbi:helix-turn-helix domain-containing protein [Streptomyces griseoruber]